MHFVTDPRTTDQLQAFYITCINVIVKVVQRSIIIFIFIRILWEIAFFICIWRVNIVASFTSDVTGILLTVLCLSGIHFVYS